MLRESSWRKMASWKMAAIVAILVGGVGCDTGPGTRDARIISLPDGGSPEPDAAFDAGIPDRPDTGPETRFDAGGSPLLGSCRTNADCAPSLGCLTEFPSPFCSRACTRDSDCGGGAVMCTGGLCSPVCTAGGRQCDAIGGACLVLGGDVIGCIPTCGSFGDRCTVGACFRDTGACLATPPTGAELGAPCEAAGDCRSGFCYPERFESEPTGYYQGMCVSFARYEGSQAQGGCPAGSVLAADPATTPVGMAVGCYRECMVEDCRPGYFCASFVPGTSGFCAPTSCAVPGYPPCPPGAICEVGADGYGACTTCTPMCTGRDCGMDGCGGDCGTCASGYTCNAGICECVPPSAAALCSAAGADCGTITVTDACGGARTVGCGTCTSVSTCGAITPNRCGCVAETDAELCTAAGATCGTISRFDRCAVRRSLLCGTCLAPETCGGGGVAGTCGSCTPETDAELCTAASATCGSISVTDRCGTARSVGCGTCVSPETCGGAGVANTCGICTPSCAGRICGGDGCGGSCGTCAVGERCRLGACETIPCDPVDNTGCTSSERCEATTGICGPAGPQMAWDSCFGSSDCAGEHVCTSGNLCREYCNVDSDCRDGRCVHDLPGTSVGLCSRTCDPVTSSGCAGIYGCFVFDSSRTREATDCLIYGSGLTGSSCSVAVHCSRGYTCAGGSCRRTCLLGTTCSGGATCAGISGWSTYGYCP